MAATSLVTQINLEIRELLRQHNWYDPDKFGLRLADGIERGLQRGLPVTGAVRLALHGTRSSFFRANRGSKARFTTALESRLDAVGISGTTTLETLLAFKDYAERQLVSDLRRDPTEAPARAFLQTYLEQQGRTYREVEASGGRMDILVLGGARAAVVETKLWRGQSYHEDGLIELSRYLHGEGLQNGYCVVFEFFMTDPATPDTETRQVEGRAIETVFVHVPMTSPSKLGRARRRRR